MSGCVFCFGPLRLDAGRGRLMRGSDPVRLRPKAFELLRFFVTKPGQPLEKDVILDAVWPDVHVTDVALKVVVGELREALGDRSDRPRFIETAHRRGYRFVAEVSVAEEQPPGHEPLSRRTSSLLAWPAGGVPTSRAAVGLVGRHREIALLEERLARALRGARQIVDSCVGPDNYVRNTGTLNRSRRAARCRLRSKHPKATSAPSNFRASAEESWTES